MMFPRLLLAAGALGMLAFVLHGRGVFSIAQPDTPGFVLADMEVPDGPLYVLALGTSLTARGPWPAELEALLREKRPGSRVEVLAKSGANSRWGEDALKGRLASGPAPHMVLIEFATNDASLVHGMTLADSTARHARMVRRVRAAGAVPVLMLMAPAHGREWLERPGLTAYQHAYRRTPDTGIIDSIGLWQYLPEAVRERLLPDGLHPVPEAWRQLLLPLVTGYLGYQECPDISSGPAC